MASKYLTAAAATIGAFSIIFGTVEAHAAPFNDDIRINCQSDDQSCGGDIKIPGEDDAIINFVSCNFGYTGDVVVQINILQGGKNGAFFYLLPVKPNDVATISQTTHIFVPSGANPIIIFRSFTGEITIRPDCSVSGTIG